MKTTDLVKEYIKTRKIKKLPEKIEFKENSLDKWTELPMLLIWRINRRFYWFLRELFDPFWKQLPRNPYEDTHLVGEGNYTYITEIKLFWRVRNEVVSKLTEYQIQMAYFLRDLMGKDYHYWLHRVQKY